MNARTVVWGGGKGLLVDPGSESRLGREREKERAKIIDGISNCNKIHLFVRRRCTCFSVCTLRTVGLARSMRAIYIMVIFLGDRDLVGSFVRRGLRMGFS